MDFVTDSLVTGRRFRALAIVDDYSRECPAIEVDISLGGRRVVSVLERLEELRGLPEIITVDNVPEFAGKALDEWAYRKGIRLSFIRPDKPIENAFAESFNGRLRDECLNTNWFLSLKHARDARIFGITRSQAYRVVVDAYLKSGVRRPGKATDGTGALNIVVLLNV